MQFLISISDFLWGWPLILFMMAVAVVLTYTTGGVQFVRFGYMLRTTFGKLFNKNSAGDGTIHPYQAAFTSLAACVGIGNIAGVGMAIGIGGPGALFWMWVVSLFSMIAKYSEVVLGVHYREKDKETGEFVAGPMYYITNGLGRNWKWLALLYSFMFGCTYLVYSFVQSNTIAVAMEGLIGIKPLPTGIILAVCAGFIIFGGLHRLTSAAEKLVPIMTILYLLGVLYIVVTNIGMLPSVIVQVITEAFTGTAALGGFTGSTILMAIRHGFARGVFSNDGGLGLGAVLHGRAITTHPAKQGMWGLFEVFLDTNIVCTGTALAILFMGSWESGERGLNLTRLAFTTGLPNAWLGNVVVSLGVLLFGFTTIIANAYYCQVGMRYVFSWVKEKTLSRVVQAACVLGVVFGAVGGLMAIWDLADLFMALLIVINLPVVLSKARLVGKLTYEFFGTGRHKEELRADQGKG